MGNSERTPPRRGRPPLPLPDPLPDTIENVARALLAAPPKREDEMDRNILDIATNGQVTEWLNVSRHARPNMGG